MDYYERTKKMFHVNDIVQVKSGTDFKATDQTFTATDNMRRMIGADMIVTKVNRSDLTDSGCVHAGGWSWHPDDLVVVEYANEGPLVTDGPEGIFTFDPQTL